MASNWMKWLVAGSMAFCALPTVTQASHWTGKTKTTTVSVTHTGKAKVQKVKHKHKKGKKHHKKHKATT